MVKEVSSAAAIVAVPEMAERVLVATGLFAANILGTMLVLRERAREKLRFLGPELVFLVLGLTVLRFFSAAGNGKNLRFAIFVIVLVLWLACLFVVATFVKDAEPGRSGFLFLTWFLGAAVLVSEVSDMLSTALLRLASMLF